MSGSARLTSLSGLAPSARLPGYRPEDHDVGIVHLGLGAFHKAHQAVFTDDALMRSGGNWRIVGASLRSADVADSLNPQNGLYTLLERGQAGTSARIVGSIAAVIAANRDPTALLAAMTRPQTKIVSVTVTEKAYGIVRATGEVDTAHPAIANDLAGPENPVGILGFLTRALQARRQRGLPPLTVLCCDNLPDNGTLLGAGVLDFAGRIDAGLRDWIADHVSFPSTMVDRITPASTARTFADAEALTGFVDLAAVETEAFSQWVIEDNFVAGRPDWEAGGTIFTHQVKPFEHMKLRMLNGSHSMMAYAGFLSGHAYVRDVMTSPALKALVERHLGAAAATLDVLPEIELSDYAAELADRFSNPSIAHETYQIAMDGSQKMPQRIFEPAMVAADRGQNLDAFAFATAVWMRYCLGRGDDGLGYDLRDPIGDRLSLLANDNRSSGDAIFAAISSLPDLMPARLAALPLFRKSVADKLDHALNAGMDALIAKETRG
jgi:fructuronate reductase